MKNKYYFLTHLNNVGYNATGEISHLITPLRFNEPASVGDGRSAARWITLRAAPLSFKQSRTHFNNDKLLSLNAIFNPLKKIKIHTLVFSNWDENQYVRKRRDNTEVHDTHFTNTEDYVLSKSKTALFGKAEVTYRPAKSQEIAAITKYYLAHRPNSGNVVFNGNPTKETLYDHNRRIDQKITYTNNIQEKTTLLITGRYIDERVSQDYRVNNYFFQGLFSDTNTVNNVRQSVDNSMHLAGVEAHWFRRGRKGHLLELRLGNLWRRDGLKSRFQLLEQQNPVGEPTGFQNNFIYQTNDTYFDSQYRYTINGLSLIGRVALHQLFNRINSSNAGRTQTPFFVNPSIGLDWKINDKNSIKTVYSYNTTNVGVVGVYDRFMLRNFRNFSKGTGTFNRLEASSMVLNYRLGNWSDRFFANAFLMLSQDHDFLSTNTTLRPNYSLAKNILIKNRFLLRAHTNVDYYFKKLSLNLKITLGYNQSDFANVVNDSDLRKVALKNYSYGAEVRSSFIGFFNFNIGLTWTSKEVAVRTASSNSFTNHVSFIDLSFVFHERWNIQIQAERYFFGNLQRDNTYYFLDVDVRCRVKHNKLSVGLKGRNLLNTDTFRSFSISNIGSSTAEYRLLPRYVLLIVEYKF